MVPETLQEVADFGTSQILEAFCCCECQCQTTAQSNLYAGPYCTLESFLEYLFSLVNEISSTLTSLSCAQKILASPKLNLESWQFLLSIQPRNKNTWGSLRKRDWHKSGKICMCYYHLCQKVPGEMGRGVYPLGTVCITVYVTVLLEVCLLYMSS